MYLFAIVAVVMILLQMVFTCILLWKFYKADDTSVAEFEVMSVFPDIVWYMVFGLIGGIAGVNGFSTQKPDPQQQEIVEPDEPIIH